MSGQPCTTMSSTRRQSPSGNTVEWHIRYRLHPKEIQLALQSIAVAVSYLSRISANAVEQCLQPSRQSPEPLSAVRLDPPPIRMLWGALSDELTAEVRVKTHARSHGRPVSPNEVCHAVRSKKSV